MVDFFKKIIKFVLILFYEIIINSLSLYILTYIVGILNLIFCIFLVLDYLYIVVYNDKYTKYCVLQYILEGYDVKIRC